MPKKNVWTVLHPDGGWANKLEGSSRFLNRAPTKREAQALGRERAMKDKVEHVIQNKDGQIGQRNSYGHDPRNVPGQEDKAPTGLPNHATARSGVKGMAARLYDRRGGPGWDASACAAAQVP